MLGSNTEELVHHGYLGDIVPEYELEDKGDYVLLKKTYDEDDFVNFDFSLGGDLPNIEYSSEILVNKNTGIAEHGEMNMTF